MKKTKTILVSLLLFMILLIIGATTVQTPQMDYTTLRASSAADDTALDGTTASYTYAFGDLPTASTRRAATMHPDWDNVTIYFFGTDAANEACTFKIYAYKSTNGPATLVCTGTATLGTAVTGGTNEFYADTISTTDYWPTDIVIADSGNNRVCTLSFDLLGHKYLFCELQASTGTCATMAAKITGF